MPELRLPCALQNEDTAEYVAETSEESREGQGQGEGEEPSGEGRAPRGGGVSVREWDTFRGCPCPNSTASVGRRCCRFDERLENHQAVHGCRPSSSSFTVRSLVPKSVPSPLTNFHRSCAAERSGSIPRPVTLGRGRMVPYTAKETWRDEPFLFKFPLNSGTWPVVVKNQLWIKAWSKQRGDQREKKKKKEEVWLDGIPFHRFSLLHRALFILLNCTILELAVAAILHAFYPLISLNDSPLPPTPLSLFLHFHSFSERSLSPNRFRSL